jgi:hypothetical protein
MKMADLSVFVESFRNKKNLLGVIFGDYYTNDDWKNNELRGFRAAFVITDLFVDNAYELSMNIRILDTGQGIKLKDKLLGSHEFGTDIHVSTSSTITANDKTQSFEVVEFLSIDIRDHWLNTNQTDMPGGVVKVVTIPKETVEIQEELNQEDPYDSTGDIDYDIKQLEILQMKVNIIHDLYTTFRRGDDTPYFNVDFLLQKYLGMTQDDIEKMKNTEK